MKKKREKNRKNKLALSQFYITKLSKQQHNSTNFCNVDFIYHIFISFLNKLNLKN